MWVSLAGLLAFALGSATCVACNGIAFVVEGQDTLSEQVWVWLQWGWASYMLLVVVFIAAFGFLAWLFIHFWYLGRSG